MSLLVLGTEIVQRRAVDLRNHEAMERRLRMNVLEREQRLGLVDSIRRNLARDDLAK